MKLTLLLLFSFVITLNSISQSWQYYFSGHAVYEVDVRDSLVIAGLDFQVAVYNMNTGQTSYHMPSTNPLGEALRIETVGIDGNNSFWMGVQDYGNGLFEYDGNWNNYLSSNSSLPDNWPSNMYVNHSSDRMWIDVAYQKATFDGTTHTPIGPYTGDCEEHNDTLWIANSPNGLVKYDIGTATATLFDTTVTQLSSNDIRHIAVDGNNKVWFTMAQVDTLTWDQWYTLGSYDGVTWNEYDTSNSTMPFYWWPKKIQIDTNDNVVIAQTYNNGLIEFDGITATQYSSALGNFPDVWVNSLHIDDNGNRWVSTNSNGLLKINGGIVETIPTSEYILNNNRTTSVLVASDGKKWFAINDANNPNTRSGVFTLDTNNVWTSFELELDGIMGSPYAIEEDASGNIYVVGRFTTMKYNGNTWIETACEQGSSVRTDIAFDNFGNYWKGRDQSYIVKCDETFYEQISYGGNGHHSVEVDFADNIWIGTQYTIVKMDQNENYTTYGFSEIGPGSINDIEFDSQQHLWATGAHNLIEFDGTTWIFHPYPSMSYTTDIEIDNYDNVWVSFLGGVGRFDGSNWLVYDTSNTFFVDDYVVEISLDIPNNTLWGATYSGGIFSFTDSNLIAGIDEINTELKTNVYPNPASEIVNIDIDVIYAEDALITLIDLNGNLIKKQVSSGPNNILEIANVTPGFYLLKVASHGFEASKKLVIK